MSTTSTISTSTTSDIDEYPLPPVVPVDRGNGQFEYISDIHTRRMLINAFQAITITETWDFVAKDRNSFMLDTSPEIYRIMNAMDTCQYSPGHSGASFGLTMRHMQYLAEYGEEKHRLGALTM